MNSIKHERGSATNNQGLKKATRFIGEGRIFGKFLTQDPVDSVANEENAAHPPKESPTALVTPYEMPSRIRNVLFTPEYPLPPSFAGDSLNGANRLGLINDASVVALQHGGLYFGNLNETQERVYQSPVGDKKEITIKEYFQNAAANLYLLKYLNRDLKVLSSGYEKARKAIEALPEGSRAGKVGFGFSVEIRKLNQQELGAIENTRKTIREVYNSLSSEKDADGSVKFIRSEESKHLESEALFPDMQISFKVTREIPRKGQEAERITSDFCLRFDSRALAKEEQENLYSLALQLKDAAQSEDRNKVDDVYSRLFEMADRANILQFGKMSNLRLYDVWTFGSIMNGMVTSNVELHACYLYDVHAIGLVKDMIIYDGALTGLQQKQVWVRSEHYGVMTKDQDWETCQILTESAGGSVPIFKESNNPLGGAYRRAYSNYFKDYYWKSPNPLKWLQGLIEIPDMIEAIPTLFGMSISGGFPCDLRGCKFPKNTPLSAHIENNFRKHTRVFKEKISSNIITNANTKWGSDAADQAMKEYVPPRHLREKDEVREALRIAHLASSTHKITLPDAHGQLDCVAPNQNIWLHVQRSDKKQLVFSVYFAEADKDGLTEFRMLRGPYYCKPEKFAKLKSFLMTTDREAGLLMHNLRFKGQHHEFRERDLKRPGMQISAALKEFGFTEQVGLLARAQKYFNRSISYEERIKQREIAKVVGRLKKVGGASVALDVDSKLLKKGEVNSLVEKIETKIQYAQRQAATVSDETSKAEFLKEQNRLELERTRAKKLGDEITKDIERWRQAKDFITSHAQIVIAKEENRKKSAPVRPGIPLLQNSGVLDLLESLRRQGAFIAPEEGANNTDAAKEARAASNKQKNQAITDALSRVLPNLIEWRKNYTTPNEPVSFEDANSAVGFIEKYNAVSEKIEKGKDGKEEETKLDTKVISKYDRDGIGWRIVITGTQFLTDMLATTRDVLNVNGSDKNYAYYDRLYSNLRIIRTLSSEDAQPYLVYSLFLEISAGIAEALAERASIPEGEDPKKYRKKICQTLHAAIIRETTDYIIEQIRDTKFDEDSINNFERSVAKYLISAAAGDNLIRNSSVASFGGELPKLVFPEYDQRRKLADAISTLGSFRFIRDSENSLNLAKALDKQKDNLIETCGLSLDILSDPKKGFERVNVVLDRASFSGDKSRGETEEERLYGYGRQTFFIPELIQAQRESMRILLLEQLTVADLKAPFVGDNLRERILKNGDKFIDGIFGDKIKNSSLEQAKLKNHLVALMLDAADELNQFQNPSLRSGARISKIQSALSDDKKPEDTIKSLMKKDLAFLIRSVARRDAADNMNTWGHDGADVRDSGRTAFAPADAQFYGKTNLKPGITTGLEDLLGESREDENEECLW